MFWINPLRAVVMSGVLICAIGVGVPARANGESDPGDALDRFFDLEDRMAEAHRAYLKNARAPSGDDEGDELSDRYAARTPPGNDTGSNSDPRIDILLQMDELVSAQIGRLKSGDAHESAASMAAGAFFWSWNLELDLDHLFSRFERMAQNFPEAPELDDVLGVVPQAARVNGNLDAWISSLMRLSTNPHREPIRSSALLALGRLQLAEVKLTDAAATFEKLAKATADPDRRETANGYLHEIKHLQPGMEAPDFAVSRLDGTDVSLRSLRGKVVLVDFWATWCAPCIVEIPRLQAAAARFNGKPFEILSISLDDERGAAAQAVEMFRMPGTQAWDSRGWEVSEIRKLYNVQALPAWFLIDAAGRIHTRDPFGEALIPAVEAALTAGKDQPVEE